jgi:4-hydroxy-3-methylbut-2-enyl diphosphate reductase
MRIILANPRGFCAGVIMAIESLEKALALVGTPFYVYHEIVHNRYVVERFKKLGVTFVDSLSEVPDGGYVMYSAHGVSPTIREESARRGLRAIDATCPLVTKVHLEAIRFAKEGYQIILIGHDGHDEVIGTMGEAPGHIHLVETIDDVEKLAFPPETKLAYLTQTTLSVDDANVVINALRRRYPHIVGPASEDICYATQNRQEAVKHLAHLVDVVLVLGSQNSSNSQRLAELARAEGKPAYLLDSVAELKPEWLTGVQAVLVTAGASAPEEKVQELVAYLERHHGGVCEEQTIREEHVRFPLPKELRGATVPLTVRT